MEYQSQSGKWSQSENQREDCDSQEAVETSFTINNSHIQDYAHPDDHIWLTSYAVAECEASKFGSQPSIPPASSIF